MGAHPTNPPTAPETRVGAYMLGEAVGSEALATVYLGWAFEASPAQLAAARRVVGRPVTIKRLSSGLGASPFEIATLQDGAQSAARVRHPSLGAVIDVVAVDNEVFVVSEYVPGEPLSRLLRAARAASAPVPPAIAVAITVSLLDALEAVHAQAGYGEADALFHGDVRPENVIVGVDGVARLVELGMPTMWRSANSTEALAYTAPEQLLGEQGNHLADIYAAASILWEALDGKRLFARARHGGSFKVLPLLAAVTLRGLSERPDNRFASAREMARALELSVPPATPEETAAWMMQYVDEGIWARAKSVARLAEQTLTLKGQPSLAPIPQVSPLVGSRWLTPLAAHIPRAPTESALRAYASRPVTIVPPRSTVLRAVPAPSQSSPPGAAVITVPPPELQKRSWGRRLVSFAMVAAAMMAVGITGSLRAERTETSHSLRSVSVIGLTESSGAAAGTANASAASSLSPAAPAPATTRSACDRQQVFHGHAWECLKHTLGR